MTSDHESSPENAGPAGDVHFESAGDPSGNGAPGLDEAARCLAPRSEEALAALAFRLDDLGGRFTAQSEAAAAAGKRLEDVAHALGGVAQTQRLIAEQVRRLHTRLDELASGAVAGRVRAILEDVLRLSDLISGLGESGAMPAAEVLRIVSRQIDELVTAHGLTRIETTGQVDYAVHQPVECVPTNDPAEDGRVLRECRPGYRLGERVLRPATVVIASHAPADPDEGAASERPTP